MKPFRLFRWRFTHCCGHATGAAEPAGTSRREFLKTTAAGVAGLAALASLREPAAGQGRC